MMHKALLPGQGPHPGDQVQKIGTCMGSLVASPLSDRSKELKAPTSQTKSCITWAPTERSWR